MQIFLYFCRQNKLRKYANFTTHRRIHAVDGKGFKASGQAADVLAAVQQGVGEAGFAEFADRTADFGFYRCNSNDPGEDEHGKSAVANVYHGSADA